MEVMIRLRKSLWPYCVCGDRIFPKGNYDLYGPFWIMVTLIVDIAIVGFIDYHVDAWKASKDFKEGHGISI